MPIFNMTGGIGEYQYVETSRVGGSGWNDKAFSGAGLLFLYGNSVNSTISTENVGQFVNGYGFAIVPFENGEEVHFSNNCSYIYYKKI